MTSKKGPRTIFRCWYNTGGGWGGWWGGHFLYFFIIFLFIFYFFIIYFLFITFLYKLLIYNFIIFYFGGFLSGISLLNLIFVNFPLLYLIFWHFGWFAMYSSYKRQKSFNLLKFCSWYGIQTKILRWLIPRGVSAQSCRSGQQSIERLVIINNLVSIQFLL